MWTIERPDGGRGFGLTGGHTHANWANDDFRRDRAERARLGDGRGRAASRAWQSSVTAGDLRSTSMRRGGRACADCARASSTRTSAMTTLPERDGQAGQDARDLPSDYAERVYAGVLGKIIGVYLGRPFEGWTYERIRSASWARSTTTSTTGSACR